MLRIAIAFLISLSLACLNCRADAPASTHSSEIKVSWGTLHDNNDTPFASILAAPDSAWTRMDHPILNEGFTQATLWMRTTLSGEDCESYVLELSNPFLEDATLYVQRATGRLEIQTGGVAGSQIYPKMGSYHNQIFKIDALKQGEKITLYLKLHSARPVIVWPLVYDDDVFFELSFKHRLWLGVYVGVFIGFSLLSLMVWVATKDHGYLHFLLFIASGGLLQGNLLGILHEQLLYRHTYLMEWATVCLPIVAVLGYAQFTRRFLELKQISPQTDRLLRICIWMECTILPTYLLFGARVAILCGFVVGAITGVAGLLAGVIALKHGARAARFYLLANGFLNTGGLLHVLAAFQLVEATRWVIYGFPIATALNVMVVAFALADKIYLLQQARICAQSDQLSAEQKIIEVLRESESSLESRVKERTVQLEEALLQQRVQKDLLERSNASLQTLHEERGAFLQIAAHDLKNPTAAIISYADLLRERWHAWDEEKKLKRIGNIRGLAQLSFDIIRNLLDINAIETGHFTLRPQRLYPAETLQTVCESFRERCELKDIVITTELPEHPLCVMIDRTAIHQIIDNLVSNAVKYSPPGSKVYIRLEAESGHALIHIRDEGPGISEADQTRLFRKFTRLTARPTAGEHSTGLGLSIVKHIVEASGGHVGCLSRLGEGSTFFVSFPLESDEKNQAA